MKIMEWVKNQREKKNWGYYLVLALLSISALYLAFGRIFIDIMPLPDTMTIGMLKPHMLWDILPPASLIGIVYIWMYYAPVVCKDLNRLKDAFPGNDYCDLYEYFEGWLRQLYLKQPGRSGIVKILYTILWFLHLVCYMSCYCYLFIKNYQNSGCFFYYGLAAFIILNLCVVILNYSSCYICMAFVYFLIRICKLEKDHPLIYLEKFPSATRGFQLLNHTANTICVYFFLDSLFCMVGFCSFWQIINGECIDMNLLLWSALFYVTFFLIIFGLINGIFIILISRIYLHRLHDEWKFRSIKKYETNGKHMKNLAQDKISVGLLDLLIYIITLAANIGTIIAPWLKLP